MLCNPLYHTTPLRYIYSVTVSPFLTHVYRALLLPLSFLRVVKLTLLGSIISNLLLVMGCAFVAGGLVHPTQHFNAQGTAVNSGLLILAGELGGGLWVSKQVCVGGGGRGREDEESTTGLNDTAADVLTFPLQGNV